MQKVVIVVLSLSISACSPQTKPGDTPPDVELQVYEVPRGTAGDLRQALARVLGDVRDSTQPASGRVTVTPDGRMLVLASAKVQAGVRAVVDAVSQRPVKPPARIDMNYWFVLGTRGDGELPEDLRAIQPALDELVRTQGPMCFRRLEQMKLSTLAGDGGRVDNGDGISVRQDVSTTSGVVLARVNLHAGLRSLDTLVQLEPEQLVVLGQSGFREKDAKEGEQADQTLFYVMRADLRNGPDPKQP